ncbi:MAG TPA: hypothetical protein P5545_03835 [Bacteroidota bacterium]|nr:hypothetical protein [Candidatus Kapabacteria bacterium]HRS01659.1 hypothetical protein [Bacteroidota bacterium]
MKKLFSFFIAIILAYGLNSCNLNNSEGPNELGGSTNIPLAQVGNTFSLSAKVAGQQVDLNDTMEITKNEGGLQTIKVKATVPDDPKLQQYASYLPAFVFDSPGHINTEFKIKMTSEGIQDFFNKDQKAHTLVKYDCKVGDKYQLTKSNGVTITRTVTAKSDKDDFPYAFWNIKTVTVEQDSRIPGVKKIVYRANHKFGLVWVSFEMEDGTSNSSYIFTTNY